MFCEVVAGYRPKDLIESVEKGEFDCTVKEQLKELEDQITKSFSCSFIESSKKTNIQLFCEL